MDLQRQPHHDGNGILYSRTTDAILLLTPFSGETETPEPVETE